MLNITIPEHEKYDSQNNLFIYTKPQKLVLEHSLVSISKWEAKWKKPFISKEKKTNDEIIDYIRCMTINQVQDNSVYLHIPKDIIKQINEYIDSPMTATTFNNFSSTSNNGKNSVITSELIYYWMVAYNIPFECEKWHLNRLLTLVKICNIKNGSQKKMSKNEILSRNREINAARKAAMGTKG